MAPSKTPLTKEQQKQAKQKKLLLLLIPVLAVLAIVQGPKLMKAVGGGSAAETTAAATTGAADTGAAATDPAATTPAPDEATAAPVVPAGVELVDSDLPPLADEGQLVAFDRFVGKDPFKQLVVPPDESQQPDTAPDPGETDGEEEEALPDTAVLLVNDALESVKLGAAFPAEEPTFRLVSVDAAAKLIRIGLVTGSFSTGSPTVELAVGETLTLVSQPDGVRFEIELKKLATSGE
jgi:hypothetical protein